MYKRFFLPVSLLAGTIIGAGIFSLPFVFKESGFSIGFFYLTLSAIVFTITHLMYADIILRTNGNHRFPGYAQKYLGEWAFWFSIFLAVIQGLIILTIYLVLSKSFLDILLGNNAEFIKIFLFWILSSFGIFFSLRKLATIEFFITGGIIGIIVFIFGLGFLELKTLTLDYFSPIWINGLLPLGAILFSLSGRTAIPLLVDYFANSKYGMANLKRSIEWGTILPAIVYGGFVLGVAALSPIITADAVSGLIGIVPLAAMALIGILGLLSLFSSYIVIGLDVSNTLKYDLNIPRIFKILIVVGAPMLIYLAGFKNFISLVSITGGIFLSLEFIFIVIMWLRLNSLSDKTSQLFHSRKLLIAIFPLSTFSIALIYEVFKIF